MRQPVACAVVLLIVLAAICGHARQVQVISLINGDFETGDLTGWTVFTNPGASELGEGFPQVVLFDINGDAALKLSVWYSAWAAEEVVFYRILIYSQET